MPSPHADAVAFVGADHVIAARLHRHRATYAASRSLRRPPASGTFSRLGAGFLRRHRLRNAAACRSHICDIWSIMWPNVVASQGQARACMSLYGDDLLTRWSAQHRQQCGEPSMFGRPKLPRRTACIAVCCVPVLQRSRQSNRASPLSSMQSSNVVRTVIIAA